MKREACTYCDQAAVIRIGPPGTRGEPRCKRHLQGDGDLGAEAKLKARASRSRRELERARG